MSKDTPDGECSTRTAAADEAHFWPGVSEWPQFSCRLCWMVEPSISSSV